MPNPSGVFDLAAWKVTLPIGGKGKPTELAGSDLVAYSSDWMRLVPGGMQFRAAVNGVTTSGSGYPRSELRELDGKGGLASWQPKTGWHSLLVKAAVTRLPNPRTSGNSAVVVAQIHDPDNDISVFRVEDGKVWVTKGDTTHWKLADGNYQLGTPFAAQFLVNGGTVGAYYNGRLVGSFATSAKDLYFKSGAYVQANCSNSSPCSADNYGETILANAVVAHGTGPLPAPSPTPDPGPTPDPTPTPTPVGPYPTVCIIRHGEKGPTSGKPYGVKPDGSKDSHSLTTTGWQRAGALVGFFTSGRVPLPGTIVASGGKGLRPVQTVTPLAAKLGLPIVSTWDIEVDYAKAGAAVKAMTGNVLVCLEHTALGQFCAAAGLPAPPTPPDDRFDWCLIFIHDPATGWHMTQVPQMALAGDLLAPI